MDNQTLFDAADPAPLLEIPDRLEVTPRRRPDPPGWGEVTYQVFERDGWVCQRCLRCNVNKGERVIDYRGDVALRVALELERDQRDLVAGLPRGGLRKRTEKLSVVLTARATETEAAALRARYGTNAAALRAALDRLLYSA